MCHASRASLTPRTVGRAVTRCFTSGTGTYIPCTPGVTPSSSGATFPHVRPAPRDATESGGIRADVLSAPKSGHQPVRQQTHRCYEEPRCLPPGQNALELRSVLHLLCENRSINLLGEVRVDARSVRTP